MIQSSVPSDRYYDCPDLQFELIARDSTDRLLSYFNLGPATRRSGSAPGLLFGTYPLSRTARRRQIRRDCPLSGKGRRRTRQGRPTRQSGDLCRQRIQLRLSGLLDGRARCHRRKFPADRHPQGREPAPAQFPDGRLHEIPGFRRVGASGGGRHVLQRARIARQNSTSAVTRPSPTVSTASTTNSRPRS